jgi:hypothetical protein
MRHTLAVVFFFAVSSFSFGQDARADLFGGYSYVNIDTNGLSPRQSANGWEASISGSFNQWFAVEGDVSGYYKTYNISGGGSSFQCVYGVCTTSVKVTDYSFAGGPRINIKPAFIHALFGADHLTGTQSESGQPNVSASQDGMAGLVGGGVQFKVSGPWSVRASTDYVFTRHNIFGGPSVTQNNFRAGVGIVYSFGAKRASEAPARVLQPSVVPPVKEAQPAVAPPTKAPPQPAVPVATKGAVNVSSLGVVVILGSSTGAEIAEVAQNSVAALAGLHPGDVINAVDGKPVKTPMDLATELANRSAGDKVRLGYMLHGAWQIEAIVLLAH